MKFSLYWLYDFVHFPVAISLVKKAYEIDILKGFVRNIDLQ